MNPTISACAQALNLPLTPKQTELLERYASLVWEKKEMLNLTSVEDMQEIFERHICDGLQAAAYIYAQTASRPAAVADAGSGAGYIGITCAVALPQVTVTLVESLQRRCAFMNWAVMTLGLKNVKVVNKRLGQGGSFSFDFVTERAMGKLTDILPLCAPAVAPGGTFIAYQGERPDEASALLLSRLGLAAKEPIAYRLSDGKTRFLALFTKGE